MPKATKLLFKEGYTVTIKGIFNWLKLARKAAKIAEYELNTAAINRKDCFEIPEGMYENSPGEVAEEYTVACRSNCLTKTFLMGHMEFIMHNVDKRRFVIARHDDGHFYLFELINTDAGTMIQVDQYELATFFKITNTKLIATTLEDETVIEDAKAYKYYTSKLDPKSVAA